MMKKWFFLVLSLPVFFSCKKDDVASCAYTESTTIAPASETTALNTYFANNNITGFIQDSSGVFYKNYGGATGTVNPGLCSSLVVNYKGYLLNSTAAFDSATISGGVSLTLGALVVGWQKAMKFTKAGDSVVLFIPPTLGYGYVDKRNGDGDVVIPRGSNLKFDIKLINVK